MTKTMAKLTMELAERIVAGWRGSLQRAESTARRAGPPGGERAEHDPTAEVIAAALG
ncbi:hypothetical protein GCM10022419_134340 [Nonomuraea rosea]|uniref:Uncharacterized protein n=1 Tax=Nonomuraea rosea TaxID=638574 RepID=A0ABP7A6W6_9ACTN